MMSFAAARTPTGAVIGSAIFLVAAPGTVAGLVPWWIGHWQFHEWFGARLGAWFGGYVFVQALGASLIAGGLVILLETFARFAFQGMGTPAPILPTQHLVVTGSYRFVRNPMYVAVVALILGQGLLFGDVRILVYGFAGWLVAHLFVLIYEEPTLRQSFPAEYAEFYTHVPRWIPRLTPWKGRG